MTDKKFFKVILCNATFLLIIFSALIVSAQGNNNRVAIVNGTVITKAEYNREMNRFKNYMASMGKKADLKNVPDLKKRVIEDIVNTIILYQDSLKNGIRVPKAEIDAEWQKVSSQYMDGNKLKKSLRDAGITKDLIRKQIKQVLYIQKYLKDRFVDKTSIPDSEVKNFYDKNPDKFKKPETIRASHILIKVDPKADEATKKAARAKIEKILKKVKSGEDFAALAKKYSEGPSAKDGGDIGYFGRNEMVKPFENAAFALKPGQVSGIVETRFGYHIIKVTDIRKGGTYSFNEVKEPIRNYLKGNKVNKEIREYMKKLRSEAKVQIF